MAVVFEGFSIREYAWKMRSADVERCFPFSAEVSQECMVSLLPPITVARFRWWSHELGILRANSREIEETEGRRTKAKSRAPKKRSIVEIFAVAPKIHGVNDEDEGESDGEKVDGGENSSIRLIDFKLKTTTTKKKKKKRKKTIENEEKKRLDVMDALKQKKKIKKQGEKNEKKLKKMANYGPIDKKVNKYKMHAQVNFAKQMDGTHCSLRTAEDTSYVVSLGKKAGLQQVSALKKDKVVQTSKSITNDQEPIFPVHSILKKHNVNPLETASKCKLNNAGKLNPSVVQHGKHVRFSDHSNILAQQKKNISCFEQIACSLHSNALAFSSGKDQCSESSRELPTICSDRHKSDAPTNAPKERAKNLSNKFIFPSEVELCYDDFGLVNDNVLVVSHRALNSGWKLTDYADNVHGFAAATSKRKGQLLPQHTPSGFTSNEITNRTLFLSQPAPENRHPCPLQYQTFCYQSPVELTRGLCPFPEGKQKAVVYSEWPMDDEFPGLPLNSQGELVQGDGSHFGGLSQLGGSGFTSGASRSLSTERNVGHNTNLKKHFSQGDGTLFGGLSRFGGSHFTTGPSRSLSTQRNVGKHVTEKTLAKDQLDLFPVHKFQNEKLPMYLPARLGVDETFSEKADAVWGSSYRGSDGTVHSLNSDLNLKSDSLNICKQKDQIQNQNGKSIIELRKNTDHMFWNNGPATMRLMGKDVTVGRSRTEMQLSWEGKVSTNEGIIAEGCPISSSLSPIDDSSLKGHIRQGSLLPPALGNSEKTPTQTFGNQWNKALQSNTSMKNHVPRFLDRHGNWPTQASRGLITDQDSSQTFLKVCPPPPSCPMLHEDFNFKVSVLPQNISPRISTFKPQLPLIPNPQNTIPCIDHSTANLNFDPIVPPARKTSFNFPFLHPDSSNDVFKSSIPWLLHTAQQVKATVTPQLFPEAGGKCQASESVPNYHTTISAHQSPAINYPQDPMSSCSQGGNSLGLTSKNNTRVLGAFSGTKQASYISISKRNRIKVKDRMKSKAVGTKDADNIKKNSKRQAVAEEFPSKHHKMPKLQAVKELVPKILSGNIQDNAGSLDLRQVQANTVHCTRNELPGDVLRASPHTEFCRNGIRASPIKLSAGAKHILEPNQNMNRGDPWSMRSTMPLISVSDCDSFAGSQMKKSSKIFRFER